MVIGIVAVLKAGGAYVPLDGGIVTDSSLDHVLSDSQAVLTLTQRDFAHRVAAHPHLCLEDVTADDGADASKPPDLSSPRDGVYVIYTSGTTGKPKGVDVMHYNVCNLLCLYPGNIGMKPGLRVAQLLNIAFDMCAWEVLGSLANGCTLCLRGKSSKEWKAVLKTVDVVIATPSVLGLYDPADYPNIKFVATAGEVCPQNLADRWSKNAQFFNSCGPTEITIVNTVQPHIAGAPISIGRPTPNNNVYVLDDNLKPLPMGEQGIMWAGGAGVTRGYLNLPDKTAERYCLDPFANDGSLMFNTGDIGRWRMDGQLEHLGRADDQVKVKGFRVELDGVAAAMETCRGIRVATALLVGTELWGFFTPATVSEADVRAATAKIQPYYAVPSHFVPLTAFSHTPNGKIDKRVLRSMVDDLKAQAPAVQAEAVPSSPSTPDISPRVPRSFDFPAKPSTPRRTSRVTLNGRSIHRASSSRSDSVTSSPVSSLKLQDCKCEPGLASEQLHLISVPFRATEFREQASVRVEVVSVASGAKGVLPHGIFDGMIPSKAGWHTAGDIVASRFSDFSHQATCAMLFVGREVLSATPTTLVSNCARCNGWGHATSTCPAGVAPKEKIADIACSLTQQAGVEHVCIVSDPTTSRAVVRELGHRGVPVVVGAMG